MNDTSPIFLLNGPPGAGKSTVAARLLQRFPFGIHIPVDDLREWVVSGIAHPVPQWTDETSRQFRLARAAVLQTSQLYHDAHFAVAIDDLIFAEEAEVDYGALLATRTLHKVLLLPSVEVAIERNVERRNKSFDTSSLNETIHTLRRSMADQPFADLGWITIDNSALTIDETVDVILAMCHPHP